MAERSSLLPRILDSQSAETKTKSAAHLYARGCKQVQSKGCCWSFGPRPKFSFHFSLRQRRIGSFCPTSWSISGNGCERMRSAGPKSFVQNRSTCEVTLVRTQTLSRPEAMNADLVSRWQGPRSRAGCSKSRGRAGTRSNACCPRSGLMRMKCKTKNDGKVGWVTAIGNTGTALGTDLAAGSRSVRAHFRPCACRALVATLSGTGLTAQDSYAV